MELTPIRYFVAVAQCGSMTRAAQQLHVTQPSLSKSLSKLEAELGCALFDRSGKRLVLNECGERFLAGGVAMLRELDDATFDVIEMTQGRTSRLAVGLSQSDSLLDDVLTGFMKEHPAVRLSLTGDIEFIDQLDINLFDMLLYPAGERYSKFRGVVVARERYLLAIERRRADDFGSAVEVSQLADVGLAFLAGGAGFVEQPFELCLGMGITPQVRCFTNSVERHRAVIASGAAAGFVREGCASPYRHDPRICLLPMEESDFATDMMLCFKRDKHLSEMGRALKEYVSAELGLA